MENQFLKNFRIFGYLKVRIMNAHRTCRGLLLLLSCCCLCTSAAQDTLVPTYWKISDINSITLPVNASTQLPYTGQMELSGRKVSSIIDYEIDSLGVLRVNRDVIFPQLRTYPESNEPEWKKYQAYFRRNYSDAIRPKIILNDTLLVPSQIDSVTISGMLRFYHSPIKDIQIIRTFYPSMDQRFIVEEYQLSNTSDSVKTLKFSNVSLTQKELGHKGNYTHQAFSTALDSIQLAKNETYSFPVYYGATLDEERKSSFNYQQALRTRQSFLDEMYSKLQLETPDPVINTFFYFSKIRAAESIFDSSMGIVHSPGGGNYYAGVWANDQIAHSGPFFPFLGYVQGNLAAYHAYVKFLKHLPKDGSRLPHAFEMDGMLVMDHLDRGAAAMVAYGTSLYLLTSGDERDAEKLWPLITYAIEYCHDMRNKDGVVQATSGKSNLATSSLYFGGLVYASRLAAELGKTVKQKVFQRRAEVLKQDIENYFGAVLDGLETYRQDDGNTQLGHWISLPLAMGIDDRKEGTLSALFERLWTPNGVLVQTSTNIPQKESVILDRATLHALRGAFRVGLVDTAYAKLAAYSKKRLLGERAPYAIEAYPGLTTKQLSTESALYCRIITEGVLGMEPIGFKTTELRPKLPEAWNFLELKDVYISGKPLTITLNRVERTNTIQVQIRIQGRTVLDKNIVNGDPLLLRFF